MRDGAAIDQVRHNIGPGANQVPPFLHIAVLLDDFGGQNKSTVIDEDQRQRPELWLPQLHNDHVVVGGRYRGEWDSLEYAGITCRRCGEAAAQTPYTVKAKYDILGRQLPTVHRCLLMPVNPLADFEDHRGGVSGVSQLSASRPVMTERRRGEPQFFLFDPFF